MVYDEPVNKEDKHMSLAIGFNFSISVEDQMYYGLVEGRNDILTLSYTKDSIFKGDFLTLSPKSASYEQMSFEIIGHVNTIEDKNGKPIEKKMRVTPIFKCDSNRFSKLMQKCHFKLVYLNEMKKRIQEQIQSLDEQVNYNHKCLSDWESTLNYTILCLNEKRQELSMQELMDSQSALSRYNVKLTDKEKLETKINELTAQINKEVLEYKDLNSETNTLETQLKSSMELKQYIVSQITSNKNEIMDYQKLIQTRNNEFPINKKHS